MKNPFLFFALSFLGVSCVSEKKMVESEPVFVKNDFFSLNNLEKINEVGDRTAKKKVLKLSPVVRRYCLYFKNKLGPAVSELSFLRGKSGSYKGVYKGVLDFSYEDCLKLPPKKVASLLKPVKNIKNKKIALVLPLSGALKGRGKLFLEGVQSFLKEERKEFEDYFVLYDTASSLERAKKVYAQIFLEARNSLTLGGLDKEEALFLKTTASDLHAPVLVFDRGGKRVKSSSYFFQVLPKISSQAGTLAENCFLRGMKKVALFRPIHGYADSLIKNLARELMKREITVEIIPSYESGNYRSMSAAVESIRPPEEIYQAEAPIEEGTEEEVPFGITLFEKEEPLMPENPAFTLDGVFIPDDFRILKHFVKLFEFHKIPKLTLFGNEQWRSDNLIALWEEYWNDSFFVDFMGSLKEIPYAITNGEPKSTLGRASDILQLDGKRLGYYGAKIALLPFKEKSPSYSHDLARALKALKAHRVFDEVQHIFGDIEEGFHWPHYVFSLKDGEVEVSTSL